MDGRLIVGTAAIVICALALGIAAAPASAKTPQVAVKLTDFKITPAVKSVKAGKVTFVVSNPASMVHEMVVIKTKLPAAKLPVKNGLASEKGIVGAARNIKSHKTKNLALKLKAGHYALICNLPGHYVAGMRTDFTVR